MYGFNVELNLQWVCEGAVAIFGNDAMTIEEIAQSACGDMCYLWCRTGWCSIRAYEPECHKLRSTEDVRPAADEGSKAMTLCAPGGTEPYCRTGMDFWSIPEGGVFSPDASPPREAMPGGPRSYELSDIFRLYGEEYRAHHVLLSPKILFSCEEFSKLLIWLVKPH